MKKLCLIAMVVAAGVSAAAETASTAGTSDKAAESTTTTTKKTSAEKAKKAGTMTLTDARGKIDEILKDNKPGDIMRDVMECLTAEDQKQFLADVNKAIGELPASLEEKVALYLNMNKAGVAAAQPGNTKTLIAETFATVPPEALTVLNEKFATDLLTRSADSEFSLTDEEYTKMAVELVQEVLNRTSEMDNNSARTAFAIIMLIRASNGTPADLTDKLVDQLPNDEARELAKNEWIPSALGKDDRTLGYESLLASADAGRRPDVDFVLVIAGPQYLDSVLQDLSGKNVDPLAYSQTKTPVLDAVENPLNNQIPDVGTGAAADSGGKTPSSDDPRPEPGPYAGQ